MKHMYNDTFHLWGKQPVETFDYVFLSITNSDLLFFLKESISMLNEISAGAQKLRTDFSGSCGF